MSQGTKKSVLLLGTGAIGGALITAFIFLGVQYAPIESRDESRTPTARSSSSSDSELRHTSLSPISESGLLFEEGSSGSVDATLRIESDFDQIVALYNLLAGASEERVLELIDQARVIKQPSQRLLTLSTIFSKYAAIDPVRALDKAQEFGRFTRGPLIDSVFHQWAKSDLDDALRSANSLKGEQKGIAARSILDARDELSLDRLYAIADELQDWGFLREVIARHWEATAREDPRSAWQSALLSTGEVRHRNLVLATVAEIWIEKEGVSVLDEISVSSLKVGDKMRIYESVLGRIAETDLENAINVATNLELSSSSSVVSEIFAKWAEKEPYRLFGLADSFDHRFVSTAKRRALEAIARISPQEAVNLLGEVDNSAFVIRTAPKIATQWAYTDPKSSLEWYMSSDRSRHDPALRFIMERLVEEDAATAFKIVTDYPGEQGAVLTSSFFSVLLNQGSVDAMEFISLLDDDKKQGPVTLIGQRLAESDINQALELEKTIPESGRQEFRLSVISAASYPDPFHLYEHIDQLPSADLQSQAAFQLLMRDKSEGVFSANQLKDLQARLDARGQRMVDGFHVIGRYDE